MCDELNEEVERGNNLAKQLAEHCKEMGADKMTNQYVDEEGYIYIIIVEKQRI